MLKWPARPRVGLFIDDIVTGLPTHSVGADK